MEMTGERLRYRNIYDMKDREKQFRVIDEYINSPDFLNIQQDSIDHVLNHVELINQELYQLLQREVIDHVSFRIKSAESIHKKLIHKKLPVSIKSINEELVDVAGVRIVCAFLDDVYRIGERIQAIEDLEIIDVRDYIKRPKNSGYQSLHIIVESPIVHNSECRTLVEIQIRTVAMHFWAKLDHQLTYKMVQSKEADTLRKELKAHADEIAAIDKKMLKIRKKIEKLKVDGRDESDT